VSPTDATHERWEELAAGHALHALEPAEEQELLAHLDTCAPCRQVLDDHEFVAAQLGTLAGNSDTERPSWSHIRTGVITVGSPTASSNDSSDPTTDDLRRRRDRRRASRVLAAAAGLVAVVGVGATVWQLADDSPGPSTQIAAVQQCRQTPGCHVVQLENKATVLADTSGARVVDRGLPAPGDGRVYALWQMPRDGRPVLVSVLPALDESAPTATTPLSLAYADTAAFAISVEPVDVVPTQPTDVVATGTAS
jgi:anti-sigma-K factor RskA